MKITIFRWNKIKTLLCLISMFSCQMLFAGSDPKSSAQLEAASSPTGAGTVYVSADDTYTDSKASITANTNSNVTFKIKAVANNGYEFKQWTGEAINFTSSNLPSTVATVTTPETEDAISNYAATANFKRLPISLNTAGWVGNTVTWEQSEIRGVIISIDANNTTGVPDDDRITCFEQNGNKLKDITPSSSNKGKIEISAIYTLPEDPKNNEYKPTITVSANPKPTDYNDDNENLLTSKEYIINISVNLTPIFEITPSEVNIEVAPEKEASNNIQLTNFYFPINIIDNWSYALEGAEEFFSIEQDDLNKDKWVVKYHPGENVGTHRATLEITASFTDAYGIEWFHKSTCVITGTCDPDLIEALEIRKNEEEQTTAYYEFDMGGTTHNAFEVYSPGLTNLTLTASGSEANQGTLTNNNKSLTISSTAPETAGDHVTTFTLTGYTGSGDPISKNLEVTLRRWYEPIQFTANPQSTSIELSWKHTPFAAQYTLLRNGTKIEEWSDGTNTYTDNNVIANTAYTYTLQVQLKDGEKIYDTKEEIVNTHTLSSSSGAPGGLSILTLGNCPTLLSATGVNAEGAFAADGEALMDVLYIMDKIDETNCHVFTKSSTKQYYYSYDHTFDPTTEEVRIDKNNIGKKITNKKIYIAGTCENLFWNTDDKMGWMQPVNCEIYLDNARLRTANDITTYDLFNQKLQLDYNGSIPSYKLRANNDIHSSIFYLPEGNTTIHTKGQNYLAGNLGQRLLVKLTVEVNAFGYAALATRVVETYIPNYSSPIAIKGAYLFDNNEQPNITCTFDSQWADGSNSNGYLDLSTRTCQHSDSVQLTKKNDYIVTANSIEAAVYWTTHKGYRYASPLNTGGPNGSFIINGGHINFWPANGHAANVELHSWGTKYGMEITFSIIGGKYANYLVCGNTEWSLLCNGSTFDRSGESQLYSTDGTEMTKTKVPLDIDIISLMDNSPSSATLYGIGNGIPTGNLIINGGTISANTDPYSFAYNWTDFVGGKSVVKTAENVADDGSGQPLFGPNVVINGGTFRHPLYGTANHGTGSALNKEEYTRDELNPISQWQKNGINDYDVNEYKAKNMHSKPVSRSEISMDAPNKDYSQYANDITKVPSRNAGYVVNIGKGEEYQYGMTDVWSDENSKCYFYLPCTDRSCMDLYKSYWVEANQELKQLDAGVKTYNLVVDKGGSVALTNDYQVYGRPYYRTPFEESFYHTMSMPFTVDQFSVLDPDAGGKEVAFTSWVDSKDDPNADNTNAYFYLYFLNDDNNKQKAYGVNNAFRSYYHTHTDGSTMEKGKTYIIKFLESSGYWEENPVIFRGAKNQIIKGKNSFKFATRPTDNDPNNPEFVMDGNATFATQDISGKGEVYVVDFKKYEDDSFHAATIDEVKTLAPMQGYLIGSETTMNRYRIIGREGKVEQTALEQLIQTGWTAMGVHQAIMIMTPEDATAQIFTADGRLWKTVTLTANTGVIIDAPAGFYIVHAGNDSKKVLVH